MLINFYLRFDYDTLKRVRGTGRREKGIILGSQSRVDKILNWKKIAKINLWSLTELFLNCSYLRNDVFFEILYPDNVILNLSSI